jgi:DNA topoisomerase-2
LKDYKNNSSESSVNFVLEFENGMLYKLLETALDKNGINQFEKVFKLTSSISCERTQNVYNKDGKIVNYTNHLDILKDYYQVRLHYYQLRKKYMIDKMEKELLLLSIKVRFILDVINLKILINNKSKANVTKQLEKHKYPKMVDNCLVELTELKKMSKLEQNSASYDYLIRMPIYNLTKEKIEELKKDRDLKSSELELLKSKSEIELWTSDLTVFRQSYRKFMKAYYEYMGHNYAEITKRRRKPKKKIQLSLTKRKRKRNVKTK